MKRLLTSRMIFTQAIASGLFLLLISLLSLVQAAAANAQFKEINLVFIHGMGSSSVSTQLLADSIGEQVDEYTTVYLQKNPEITVKVNMLQRSYPAQVDIDIWAKNLADAIGKHFAGKKNLILIGHSLGGKAALYAVAQNVENIGDIVDAVVTINSPIKDMNSYYMVGGGSATNYLKARRLTTNSSLAERIGSYDSSADGLKVSQMKHWLAFISGETAPMNPEFDYSGVDPYPEDMDDGLVPISAQYAHGADVVYYGEYGHSSIVAQTEVARVLADNILRYIFGEPLKVSIDGYESSIEHHAGWLPLTYRWEDWIGESSGMTGITSHTNPSFFKWQEWEDIIEFSPNNSRSSYKASRVSIPILTGIMEVRWWNPDDQSDARLYIKTRAAPRTTVRAKWEILQSQTLPVQVERDHYEIKVTGGVALAEIRQASWTSTNNKDPRLQIRSQAEGPFRWFKCDVQVFFRQEVKRKLIDGFSVHDALGAEP